MYPNAALAWKDAVVRAHVQTSRSLLVKGKEEELQLSYRNAEEYKYRTIMLIPRTNGYP